jgi:hypothetical protein
LNEQTSITKEQIIQLAFDCMGWKKNRALSWYKLENRWLDGHSPHELVSRGQGLKVVQFLEDRKTASRED